MHLSCFPTLFMSPRDSSFKTSSILIDELRGCIAADQYDLLLSYLATERRGEKWMARERGGDQ